MHDGPPKLSRHLESHQQLAASYIMPRDSIRGQEHGETGAQDDFGGQPPENCVEYFLFILDQEDNARKQLGGLEGLRQAALQFAQTLTKDYIWQRDGFELELEARRGTRYLSSPWTLCQTLAVRGRQLTVSTYRSAIPARHHGLWGRC